MAITRVGQISIPVGDQQRALDFYTQKLGWELSADVPMGDDGRWIEVRIPGAETGLVLFAADEHKSRIGTTSDIMFNTDDIEKTFAELTGQDVEIAQPITTEFWGTFFMFKDPDGNTFLVAGTDSAQAA
ncbi:MAG: VOC family protein [Herpetosiphonaceae bacterium]|nr:VOC family protein [Herpetosiphonaceae bacterium]